MTANRRRRRRQQLEIEPLNWVAPEDRETVEAKKRLDQDEQLEHNQSNKQN